MIQSIEHKEREQIINKWGNETIISSDHVAAMKSILNLPWNQMREVSRWLKTFNIKMASEKKVREISKKWIGNGLQAELAPLSVKVKGSNRVCIVPKPWVYLYNMLAHILHRLDTLKLHNQITHHSFIPTGEVHIKIGGDHGDTSFKMAYQVANVNNPNKKENTVIFSIFEGKFSSFCIKFCYSFVQSIE